MCGGGRKGRDGGGGGGGDGDGNGVGVWVRWCVGLCVGGEDGEE